MPNVRAVLDEIDDITEALLVGFGTDEMLVSL